MAFTIPDFPSASHDAQAFPNSTDIRILMAGLDGDNIVSGGLVEAQVTPNMTVKFSTLVIRLANVDQTAITGANVTIATANSNPRRDLVIADATSVTVVAGTPVAVDPADPSAVPLLPALPADSVALAAVDVPGGATSITAAEITDKRAIVRSIPAAPGGWNVVKKASDENVTNSAVLQNDDALAFSMDASTKYVIHGVIFFDTTATGDFKYGFSAPASPTLVRVLRSPTPPGSTQTHLAVDVAQVTSENIVSASTTGGSFEFHMVVQNGANAGTFVFQWAQNTQTADAGVTVYAGSYLEWI